MTDEEVVRELRKQGLDDDQEVTALDFRQWNTRRISRATGHSAQVVKRYIDEQDEDILAVIKADHDKIKAQHIAMLRAIASNVMICPLVKDNPKLYLIAMKALSDERKILGLDAPVQTSSVQATVLTLVQPDEMQRLLTNESFRSAVLALEAATSALSSSDIAQGDLAS